MADSFTLDDFRKQLDEIVRPGLLKRLIRMVPGMGEMRRQLQSSELQSEICRLGGMIDSMTPSERRDPQSIDESRKCRIAKGAGVSPREVNDLLKQFACMAAFIKRMTEPEVSENRDPYDWYGDNDE